MKILQKYLLLIATLSGIVYSNANAQSAFAGFYGQISTGYESNQLGSMTGTDRGTPNINTDINGSAPSQTFGGIPLVLGLGYSWKVSDKWLLGLGADYSALSQTSSTFSHTLSNAAGNGSIQSGQSITPSGSSMQLSNRFNLFFSPSYVIDKDQLVYLKAGYSQVAAQYNRPTTVTLAANGTSRSIPGVGGSQSSNQSGYLLGLGYKQIITAGLYGFVEGNYMAYSSPSYSYNSIKVSETLNGQTSTNTKTTSASFNNLNSYQLLIGMGYAF
jgi:outer membrane immunogenic protein